MTVPKPDHSLEPPSSFVYTGPMSTRGRNINRFSLSLKQPENRKSFLADPDAYMTRFNLSGTEKALVRARDWSGLLAAGGHLQAILKIAAALGQNLWHIGAHNAEIPVDEMIAACPRRVGGLPEGV
jgi:protocatechuate 4,5-dioxygenase, alpha chain